MERKNTKTNLNTVIFIGDSTKIQQALTYIDNDTDIQNSLGRDFELKDDGYYSETDWEPNITGAKRIADLFDLDFTLLYDDAFEVFGEVTYEDGKITIVELDDTDFKKLSFDDATSLYTYGEEVGYNVSDFFLELFYEKLCGIFHRNKLASMQ